MHEIENFEHKTTKQADMFVINLMEFALDVGKNWTKIFL